MYQVALVSINYNAIHVYQVALFSIKYNATHVYQVALVSIKYNATHLYQVAPVSITPADFDTFLKIFDEMIFANSKICYRTTIQSIFSPEMLTFY